MTKQSNIERLLDEAWRMRKDEQYDEVRRLLNNVRTLCDEDDFIALGRVYHIYMQIDYDLGAICEGC